MKYWDDFHIIHKGINTYEDGALVMGTIIADNKTNYPVVEIYSVLAFRVLEFHIGTNEKMLKRLKLPTYKHHAEFSYMEGKKYFDQKIKKARDITCLSLGPSNVGKILRSIIQYWQSQNHYIQHIYVTRETGNTTKKEGRYYDLII